MLPFVQKIYNFVDELLRNMWLLRWTCNLFFRQPAEGTVSWRGLMKVFDIERCPCQSLRVFGRAWNNSIVWLNMLNKYMTSGNDSKISNWFIKIVEWIDPEGEGIYTNLSVLNMNCYYYVREYRLWMWIIV